MYKKLSLIFVSMLMIAGACMPTSFAASSSKKKPPSWVSSRPIDNNFYIGIGMAKKSEHNADYIQIAKSNALNDIASEISVVISGNSVLHQFEDNAGFKESFNAFTNTFVKDELEGYELVGSWENNEDYWVYYRLSKEGYKKIKRDKLNKAIELSKSFYEKAKEYESQDDISNALNSYVKAFEAIKKHLHEDISVFTFEGRVDLGSAIYKSIQDIFSSLRLKPKKMEYKRTALNAGEEEPVQVKAQYAPADRVAPVKNLPLLLYFPDNKENISEVVSTDDEGYATCSIASKTSKGKVQKINIALNLDAIFGKESEDNLLRSMFTIKGSLPQGQINMEVAELSAFLVSEEVVFGKNTGRKIVESILKEQLSEKFFSFTQDKDNADVIIRINSHVVKGGQQEKYNLYSVFLDCTISIENAKTGMEVFSEGFENLKGMKAGNFESALQDAHKKAEEKIKKEIIPEIAKITL